MVWSVAGRQQWVIFMAEARVERRLAAILALDVVGYSRLVGINEEAEMD